MGSISYMLGIKVIIVVIHKLRTYNWAMEVLSDIVFSYMLQKERK